MIHLCASYACLKLSTSLEDLVRNVYAHFSRSSKRFKNFEEFQTFCGTPVHKFLCLSQTRWLSMVSVFNRVLEQWSPLHLYFTDYVESKCDPSNIAKSSLQSLRNVFQNAVLEFMFPAEKDKFLQHYVSDRCFIASPFKSKSDEAFKRNSV